MSNATELRDLARRELASIANCSGGILYSSAETLQRGTVYLLGLNPGGDPKKLCGEDNTIGHSIETLPDCKDNAYLDENWTDRGAGKGKSPLQRRVCWLLTQLGLNPRDVCASNLIFVRSSRAGGSGYPETATLCWPVHERILRIVQPKLILTFGNSAISPFRFLQDHYQVTDPKRFSSGHGNWQCYGFSTPDGVKVIGLPHLSRYAIDKHHEVVEWMKKYAVL